MQHQRSEQTRLRFGPFEFDTRTLELRHGANPVHLPPKPARALDLLLRNAGSLVTRQELHEHVWPQTVIELDQGLNTCMRHLRSAIGDDADSPAYIETVPRRGYRFIASVAVVQSPVRDNTQRRRWPAVAVCLAVLLFGVLWLGRGDASAPPATRIAVLPLQVIGGSTDDSLFAEGISEDLLTILAGADPKRLQVIARTSAYRIAQEFSLGEMHEQFGIEFVIEGRVRPEPGGYKITTQLVDTRSLTTEWAGEYRRATSASSLQAQEHLSAQVAKGLTHVLGMSVETEPHPEPPSRVATSWLVARHFMVSGGNAEREKAAVLLGEVLAADAMFAPAQVALARVWLDMGKIHEAEGVIANAIALVGATPEILLERGRLRLRQWRLEEAGRDLEAAIAGGPENARAHHTYGYYLSVVGRHREALASMRVAEELDPVSESVLGDAGLFSFWAGKPRKAIEECQAVRRFVMPQFRLMIHRCLLYNYAALGAWDDALIEVRAILMAAGATEDERAAVLEQPIARDGMRKYFEWAAQPQNLPSSQGGDTSYRRALAAAGVGDIDRAIAALERALEEREPRLIEIGVEKRLDIVRDDPRFETIVQAVGLEL